LELQVKGRVLARRRCPVIARAEQQLRWSPRVQLEEGLGATIAYFDSLLMNPSEANKLIWKVAV
jgi:UDP-glucuronate decarboxylase